jgi:hypothetical protein
MGKPLDLRFKLRVVAKAQEDHAAMGEALPKDQLTKVSVIGNKDAFLSQRDRKHLFVGQTRCLLATDSGGVVAKSAKIGKKASIGALVEHKPHRFPGGAPEASCPTRWRFSSMAALANCKQAFTSSTVNSG